MTAGTFLQTGSSKSVGLFQDFSFQVVLYMVSLLMDGPTGQYNFHVIPGRVILLCAHHHLLSQAPVLYSVSLMARVKSLQSEIK